MSDQWVDPPSGWQYGFPRRWCKEYGPIKEWLLQNGYPKYEMDALKEHFYVRFWDADEE